MSRSRSVSLFRSVRVRIAAWNAIAFALAAMLALFGLRQAMRTMLLQDIDLVLREDLAEVGLAVREGGAGGLDAVADELRRKATGHRQHEWFVRLLDARGADLWSSAPTDTLPQLAPGPDGAPYTLGDRRIVAAELPRNSLGVHRALLGSSLDFFTADMQRIDRRVAVAVLLILIASPLCGYALAAFETRQLEHLTATAATLQPANLADRLPDRGRDDEFDRLARTINRLLDRVAEFISHERNFLTHAAHDLRTPIAAIRSSVEVALSAERSNQDYRQWLEEVLDAAGRLEVLVGQVLLLSEAMVVDGRGAREETSLGELANRSVQMFAGVAESRGVTLALAVDRDATVRGVRRLLLQLVNNLVDNAVKYTPAGGRVDVRIGGAPGQANLTVADTGPGVDPADLPAIFDRFYRADRSRTHGDVAGSGLGLSICKSIVEAHGGEIACRSTPGQGATFIVTLPAATPP